jgi:hypothetical protein
VLDGTENGTDRLAADPDVKETIKKMWFLDALFHILADAYVPHKSVPPEEVRIYSDTWSDSEDFLATFLQHYQVTQSEKDCVSNKDIVEWAKDNGFKISSVKIGLELAKVEGVKKQPSRSGAQYTCLKPTVNFPFVTEEQ